MATKTKRPEDEMSTDDHGLWLNEVLHRINRIHNELIDRFENRVSVEATDDCLVADMLNIISNIFREHNSKWDPTQDVDLDLPYSVEYMSEWDKEGNINKYSEYLVPILHDSVEFVLSIPVRRVTMAIVGDRDVSVKANLITMFNIGYPAIKAIDNTIWGNI